MKNILITGACGQIGTELALALSDKYGRRGVIATDIKPAPSALENLVYFQLLDVLDSRKLSELIRAKNIDTIFHLAAVLSATGELNPLRAFRVNMDGLLNVLEASREYKIRRILVPSSIAVFGPDAPKEETPEDVPLNPTTMYGVTKVAGEKLAQYYFLKYGLDIRSLRYPGIISSETEPGGGTTDFAVDIYYQAVQKKPYICFVSESTVLPFMHMQDAIHAMIKLATSPQEQLSRRVYNVQSFSATPAQFANSIARRYPKFKIAYQPDFRQSIADSWPHSINDSAARKDWNWNPKLNLEAMTDHMLNSLEKKLIHT